MSNVIDGTNERNTWLQGFVIWDICTHPPPCFPRKSLHEIVVNGVNITAYIREFYFGPINRGGLRLGGDR
jgi:hypothetical protein